MSGFATGHTLEIMGVITQNFRRLPSPFIPLLFLFYSILLSRLDQARTRTIRELDEED